MHKISIKPGGGISLAPFADVHKLAGISQNSGELSDDTGTDDAETEEFGQVTALWRCRDRNLPFINFKSGSLRSSAGSLTVTSEP